MTSISDLSHDLLTEILSRVPKTSLEEMRSTCKLWNTLTKDPSFKHGGEAPKEIMVVMMYDYEACLMNVNLHNHNDLVEPFITKIGKLKHVDICEVFHCNGLLLCVTCEPNNSRLLVWNPNTGQTRWIQPRKEYLTSEPYVYAMGYDSNNNQKILRFSYWLRHTRYEIYDFKSKLWRALNVYINWHIDGQGVSLKGNNYFITDEKLAVGEKALKKGLLSFDFTRERFCNLPLPCHSSVYTDTEDSVILSVVREEKLAVLSRRCHPLEMEIWITNKIEPNEVSWSCLLKVDKITSARFGNLKGSFFVDEKKKVAVICDMKMRTNYKEGDPRLCPHSFMVGEGGHYREVDLGESLCRPLMCSPYVPSSVQIQ